MPDEQRFTPQLVMLRPDLAGLAPVTVPAGYAVRTFRDGDEAGWERVIAKSFNREANPNRFDPLMRGHKSFRPERVYFVVHGDEPVATASAWLMDPWPADTGFLHMVGVMPEHQGHRLGHWVSLAVLHHFVREERTRAVLQTDDFRVAAVKTYLKLGFVPFLIHENQRERWRNLFGVVGLDAPTRSRLEPLLSGDVRVSGVL